jgi:sec-independent protein translocase protein TatA/sec-independent protein translocase protein TatB
MFGFGFSEIMVILIVALLVVGPKKLPEVAKMIGRGYAQFKRAFEDIKDTVDLDLDDTKYTYKKPKNSLNDIYREKWEKDIAKSENAEDSNDNNEVLNGEDINKKIDDNNTLTNDEKEDEKNS